MKGKILAILVSIWSCNPKSSAEYTKAGKKNLYTNKSEQNLRKAIKLDSTNHEAFFLLGDNYRMRFMLTNKRVDFDSAEFCFRKAISLGSSENHFYWFMLGEIYHYRGAMKDTNGYYRIDISDLNKAINHFSESIAIDSTKGIVYYSRSRCYSFLRDSINDRRDIIKSCLLGYHMACVVLNMEKH